MPVRMNCDVESGTATRSMSCELTLGKAIDVEIVRRNADRAAVVEI